MSEFLAFARLGFGHIVDVGGADHILFILALAAIYRLRDWRETLGVVTAFTAGHSLTLALAVTGVVALPMPLIEFLIPVTIVATGVENLSARGADGATWGRRYRPALAGVFGLVHGAGFANYLRSLFVDPITVPLLGFNVGLEVGQVAVLLVAAVAFTGFDRAVAAARLPAPVPAPLRLRVLAVSAVVTVIAAAWAIERRPW
jgi:hypothetical protein